MAKDRKITFANTGNSTWTNSETGILIMKVGSPGDVSYLVLVPALNKRGNQAAANARTLAAARIAATEQVRIARRDAAAVYAAATARIASREQRQGQGQARAADEARRADLASRAAGDAQDEALRSRAFRHPAYSDNRLTRSHEASMLRAITAVIADDHADALRDNIARAVDADPGLAPTVDGRGWYRLTANEHYAAAVLRTSARPGGGTMAAAMAELHDEALREHYARLCEEHGHGLPADRIMRMEEWRRSPGRVRYLLLAERWAYEENERRSAVRLGDPTNRARVHGVLRQWEAYELTSGEAVEKLMQALGVTNEGAMALLFDGSAG